MGLNSEACSQHSRIKASFSWAFIPLPRPFFAGLSSSSSSAGGEECGSCPSMDVALAACPPLLEPLVPLVVLPEPFPREFLVPPLPQEFPLAEFVAEFGGVGWLDEVGGFLAACFDWAMSSDSGSGEGDHSTGLDGAEEGGGGGGVEK